MNNKEQFYKDAFPFFYEGLIKEIYSNDNIIICNLSNFTYGVFGYIKTKEGQGGVLITADNVRNIVANPNYCNQLIDELDKHDLLLNRTIVLNNKTFEVLKKFKGKTDLTGPSADIDLKMEEELMSKNKSR